MVLKDIVVRVDMQDQRVLCLDPWDMPAVLEVWGHGVTQDQQVTYLDPRDTPAALEVWGRVDTQDHLVMQDHLVTLEVVALLDQLDPRETREMQAVKDILVAVGILVQLVPDTLVVVD